LPSSTRADLLVALFARAPVAGKAKTRLAARIGPWRAATLQRRLTLRTLQMARQAFAGRVTLLGSGPHAFFRSLRVPFEAQRGDDLGERMYRAAARALRRHRAVLIVGTDCPALTARDLRRAARLLRGAHVVLAPAEDGGYALIGLRRVRRALFEGIAWGGDAVLRDTLGAAARSGLETRLIRTVWDLDRPEDLDRLRSLRLPSGARRAARR
jgi:rSAM/selenodomain-associated transferase 1